MIIKNQKNKELYDKIIYLIYRNEIEKVNTILQKIGKYKNIDKDIENIIKDINGKLDLLNRFVIEGDSIYLYIINPCDYKCIFCDRSEEEMRKIEKDKYTNVGDIKFIIGLFEFNGTLNKFMNFDIGGHEPLANENIIEILEYLAKYQKGFIIHTSGSQPDILEKIIKKGFDIKKVIIPIYSTNEEVFNKITNSNRGYNNYYKCLKILNKERINLKSSSILIKNNKNEIELFNEYQFDLLMPNNINLINFYKNNGISFGDYISIFKRLNKKSYIKFFDKSNYTRLPLCILYNTSKEYYQEIINNLPKESYKDSIKLNIHSDMKKLQDKNREYTKPEKCNNCIANKNCNGYYRIHFEIFGDNEVIPIIN